MGVRADARVLLAMVKGAGGAGAHAERLTRFYGPQAADYDRFRERLLPGRRELVEALPVTAGARVVELGGGTGRNAEFFGARLDTLARLDVVDICAPLLEVASARFTGRTNVRCTLADATRWTPNAPVDAVYLSYALTMMPDWRATIDNAVAMLVPGGTLGVVDFHVAAHHRRSARVFWQRWFAHDGVHLSEHHVPYLRGRVAQTHYEEHMAAVPYLLGARVPYYLFLGRKRP